MKPYRYDISLRVRHPSMDPAEISAALGLEPSRMWRAGDPRKTPKNTPLDGVWRDSRWASTILKGEVPGKTLPVALAQLATQFSPHKSFFAIIRGEGGRAEFFVSWFIDGNRGDEFDAALLAQLGELGIDLSLDIYPPPNEGDEV